MFCSILTPLVGLQVLALERNYELTIGANIGTTVTAILASLTQSGLFFRQSIQIALTHFFFNLSGCVLWYMFPHCRRIPLGLSRRIGQIVAEYRWFAVVYLLVVFFFLPLLILLLALIHWIVAVLFLLCLSLFIGLILTVRYLQTAHSHWLPIVLRSWLFLPRSLRSLSYWDHRFEKLIRWACCQCCIKAIYPSNADGKPLKEQYVNMKDQYVTALDHRYLVYTHRLSQVFEKHHAPIVSVYESRNPLRGYVHDFYWSLTGRPTQGQRLLAELMKTKDDDELIDREIVFDRSKKKNNSTIEQQTLMSF